MSHQQWLGIAFGTFLSLSVTAGTDVKDVNKLAKECDEGKPQSCEKLATIATTFQEPGKAASVRMHAVAMLKDQALLTQLAKTDPDSGIRSTAASKLTDQAALADLAKNSDNMDVRELAIARLTDQTLLASLAKSNAAERIRMAATRHLTDQETLAQLAMIDKNIQVRNVAAAHVTNQAVLAEVAKEDKDAGVRQTAIAKLTDKTVLADIATHDAEVNVRTAAATRWVADLDRAKLQEIAATNTVEEVRQAADARLADLMHHEVTDLPDKPSRIAKLKTMLSAPAAGSGTVVTGLLARADNGLPLDDAKLIPCEVTFGTENGRAVFKATMTFTANMTQVTTDLVGRFTFKGLTSGKHSVCTMNGPIFVIAANGSAEPVSLDFTLTGDNQVLNLGVIEVKGGRF